MFKELKEYIFMYFHCFSQKSIDQELQLLEK